MSDLPSTNQPLSPVSVVEAGPRVMAELSKQFRLEMAKSGALGPYMAACKLMAQRELEEIHKEIELVSKENREIEKTAHHTKTHYPDARIPTAMWIKMQDIYGLDCWKDSDFYEDTLNHHPGLRIRVKYGMRGQELLRK